MATNFPAGLDTFPNPGPTTRRDEAGFELDVVVSNLGDALEAVETKVGTDGSAVPGSLDYRVNLLFQRNRVSVASPNSRNPLSADLHQSGGNTVSDDLDEAVASLSGTYGGRIDLWEGPFQQVRNWNVTRAGVTIQGAGRPNDNSPNYGTRLFPAAGFVDPHATVKALVKIVSTDELTSLGGVTLRDMAIGGTVVGTNVHALAMCAFKSRFDNLNLAQTSGNGLHMWNVGAGANQVNYQNKFGDITIRQATGVGWLLLGTDHQGEGPIYIGACQGAGIEWRGSGCQLGIVHITSNGQSGTGAGIIVYSCSENTIGSLKLEMNEVGLDFNISEGGISRFTVSSGNFASNSRSANGVKPDVRIPATSTVFTVKLRDINFTTRTGNPNMDPSYHIDAGAATRELIVDGCKFGTNAVTKKMKIHASATTDISRDNPGTPTYSSGTGTIGAAATTAAVTHNIDFHDGAGAAYVPTASQIKLWFTGNPGSASVIWPASITATQFTATVDAQPGGAGAAFAWEVDIGRVGV